MMKVGCTNPVATEWSDAGRSADPVRMQRRHPAAGESVGYRPAPVSKRKVSRAIRNSSLRGMT